MFSSHSEIIETAFVKSIVSSINAGIVYVISNHDVVRQHQNHLAKQLRNPWNADNADIADYAVKFNRSNRIIGKDNASLIKNGSVLY